MKNILKYKGYTGTVEYSADDKTLYGRVVGINDIISFEGVSVSDLERDFKNGIDDYLQTCNEIGKPAEKPYSGKFNLRIPSELHALMSLKAKQENKSLNQWVTEACQKSLS